MEIGAIAQATAHTSARVAQPVSPVIEQPRVAQSQPVETAISSDSQGTYGEGQSNPNMDSSKMEKKVQDAVDEANKKLDIGPREFEISVHEKTKQIMVKIVDSTTKEVVRELPSEKIVDMVAEMCEQAGLFVDEKR